MLHAVKSVATTSLVVSIVACTPESRVGSALSDDASGSAAPPTGPAGRAISLSAGRADADVTGDLRAVRTYGRLTTPVIYVPSVGGVTLTWRSELFEILTLAGTLAVGAQSTSSSLSLQFAVQHGGKLLAFTSDAGECDVLVDTLADDALRGTFECARLRSVDGRRAVDASGSFEASA